MRMIPIHEVHGNLIEEARARAAALPVIVLSATAFLIPPATGTEQEHLVLADRPESPAAFSCTCAAAATGTACWAMARAFDVMTLLGGNLIYIGRGESGRMSAAAVAIEPRVFATRAEIDERGDLALLFAFPPAEAARALAG